LERTERTFSDRDTYSVIFIVVSEKIQFIIISLLCGGSLFLLGRGFLLLGGSSLLLGTLGRGRTSPCVADNIIKSVDENPPGEGVGVCGNAGNGVLEGFVSLTIGRGGLLTIYRSNYKDAHTLQGTAGH
jgi:hypothetical protein